MLSYNLILIAFIFTFLLCSFLLILSYLISNDKPDSQKLSVYECGFNPFSDTRIEFDVKFFLVGILFIIFDLELSFLFPWSMFLFHLDFLSFISMVYFLLVLTLGLVYEWLKGGLEWA